MSPRPVTLAAMILSMVTGIAVGVAGFHHYHAAPPASDTAQTVARVLREIDEHYVTPVAQEQLLGDALNGIMQGLDPHSAYLDQRDYDDLQAETSGHFGGIGVQLGLVDGYFTVIAPIDGTPASRAGLQAGDVLIAVDRTPLKGEQLRDVVDLLRGVPGTDVTLATQRDGAPARDVTLRRAVITVASVSSRLLDDDIGYLRIAQFQSDTAKDLEQAIHRLTAQANGPLSGLVLDLRNNPGGILQQSVAVADAFLTSGLIVYTSGRQPSSQLRFSASGVDLMNGAPVAVLINEGSASASEIVAGALQDHRRAVIIGATSFGKGSVQSVVPLADNQAIKLTTALYYTPNGRSIHNHGIEPDIAAPAASDDLIDVAVQQIKTHRVPLQALRR